MKPTAGYAKRRRVAPPSRTRLNLQRRPKPEPGDELDEREPGGFWKWVLLIALLHAAIIAAASLYYLFAPAPPPPPAFISLLPPGDVVKGTPGAAQAHKLGATTPTVPAHHAAPPPPAPAAVAPPEPPAESPTPVIPPAPILKDNAPPIKKEKPVKPKPKPAKPKVKIDLHEVERTDATAETTPKPVKHHAKKPAQKPDDAPDDSDSSTENTGLSKEQIAEKLGEKLDASGTPNAQKYGASGSPNGHQNDFGEFYATIRDQVHAAWTSPLTPADVEPYVRMHVERDGHVVPESVRLIKSSGDPAYDQAAIDTVKNLGQLREPLPEGCPPDITIGFNPNSSQ